MKQLLVVTEPECVPAAQVLVGDKCDVVAYDETLVIKDRKIVYWPTAPGDGSAERAQKMADSAAEVKVLVTADKPKGWNAMTAIAEGWDIKTFIEWAKPRSILIVPRTLQPADETPPTETQAAIIERLGLAVSQNRVPICNASNVVKYLERSGIHKGHIWLDEFSGQILTSKGPWTDARTIQMMIGLQNDLGLHRVTSQHVADGISFFAGTDKRHQVRDWLNGLKWDRVERITDFFSIYCGAAKTKSHYAFSSNFWVSLVKRIYEPGCQSDYMVVLEGDQGIGKTRTFQIIGGEWYAEVGITADSEDFERQLQGKILVEIAELHSFSKSDQSRIKQIITKRVDRYREKYGRIAIDHPRQGLLVGTTNETEWIKDQTGGRRFWPIKCELIDMRAIQRDRDQLFAEAIVRYKEGDPGYLLPIEDVKVLQEERRESEPWEELLREKIMLLNRVTLVEAMGFLGIPQERMDNRQSKRVAHALRRLGFSVKQFKVSGEVKRFWYKNGHSSE